MAKSTRDERLGYARALIRNHPEWGERRLNLTVQNEYGTGLRAKDLAALKQEVLFAEGKFSDTPFAEQRIITMGFVEAQHMLLSAGFLPHEIRKLFSGMGVVDMMNSAPFHAMLTERRRWVNDLRRKGYKPSQIIKAIKDWYDKNDKASPFDFLRREYKPPLRVDRKEYREAARRRAQRTTAPLYNRGKYRTQRGKDDARSTRNR